MPMRPFLKWAGGKQRCLKYILPHLPPAERLVEPFTGAATIFLNTQYQHYLLGEINTDLINLYTFLQQEHEHFINYCAQYFSPEHQTKTSYYELREQFNQSNDIKFRAALFLYLNRHGFNGLCRYNQSGYFNVPFGSHPKAAPYFPHNELASFAQKAKSAQFVCQDFEKTFAQCEPGDIVYCDPPYMPLTAKDQVFSYHKETFCIDKQKSLANLASQAKKKRISVLISNHDTPETRKLYCNADIVSFPVRRFISRDVNNRIEVKELIAIYQ